MDDLGNHALFDAAAATGADVVMVSVVGAAPDSPFELFVAKYAAEQHLRGLGVPWTIVRSSAFLETWTDLMRQVTTPRGRTIVFGRGSNPVNFVEVADVADAVTSAVVDREQRGSSIDVTGSEDLTLTELATRVSVADGRPVPPRHLPPVMLHLVAATVGRLNPQLGRQVRAALAMDAADLRGPLHVEPGALGPAAR